MIVKKYNELINEVNYFKLNKFKNNEISDKFTTSIEIEIEINDEEDDTYQGIKYNKKELSDIIKSIKSKSIRELNKEQINLTEKEIEFIDIVLSEIKMSYDDEDYIEEILNDKKYKGIQKTIIRILKNQSIIYFTEYNFTEFKNKFEEFFPTFKNKWKNDFKYEFDASLYKGLEISNKKYFNNITVLLDFISDFYKDYKNQNYWKFNEKTGIHINLGVKGADEYNFVKGLLFLNDYGDNPFMFKDMEWRKSSEFTKSILEEIRKDKKVIDKCYSLVKMKEVKKAEQIINKSILDKTIKGGYKNYGINFLSLEKENYIEFRYAGGDIKEDVLVNKVLYFCYLIYNMIDPEFDKKEYHKKLYVFLNAI